MSQQVQWKPMGVAAVKNKVGEFSGVREKMLTILSDGDWHSAEELHAVLYDSLSPLSNIQMHLTALRKMLRPLGETIACQTRDWKAELTCYRIVRTNSTD